MSQRLTEAIDAIIDAINNNRRCSVCRGASPSWDGHDANPPCIEYAKQQLARARLLELPSVRTREDQRIIEEARTTWWDPLILALARADGQPWANMAEANRHTAEQMYGAQAEAALGIFRKILHDAIGAMCDE